MWLEASGLGHAMRNAGVWSYGVANLIHILGVATLFGSVLVLDLRLLGAFARAPLAAIAAPTAPLAAIGFTIALLSGSCLIVTNATEYIGNPLLLIKFPAIALGLLNALALSFVPAWRERGTRELTVQERRQLAMFGGVSLASWLTAVACGRLIAYW
jgi:energy-coupling factor transporter transmembrane protein EcfT